MSVFYKWIKGCHPGSTPDGGGESSCWTYFSWGGGCNGTINALPTLQVSPKRVNWFTDEDTKYDLGYFLTNKATGVWIEPDWVFKNKIYLEYSGDNGKKSYIQREEDKLVIKSYNSNSESQPIHLISSKSSIYGSVELGCNSKDNKKDFPWLMRIYSQDGDCINNNTEEITNKIGAEVKGTTIIRTGKNGKNCDLYNMLVVEGRTFLGAELTTSSGGTTKVTNQMVKIPAWGDTAAVEFGKGITVTSLATLTGGATSESGSFTTTSGSFTTTSGSITTTSGQVKGQKLEATEYCKAPYFNATSDKRAKENIEPAAYSALELISKLPIYNYNYKSNPSERVTGILAQDLLAAQPAELDLVSNKEATGENGDYMSIKTDKITFVLMKAIQELQEEIVKLKDEIQQLKN